VTQLSFCVSFNENIKVYEEVNKFELVTNCTGKGLATAIKIVKDFNFNGMKMVGQGYDRTGAMSGWMNGAQAIIQEEYPNAINVQCASHSFNLALTEGCKLPRNTKLHGNFGFHLRIFQIS